MKTSQRAMLWVLLAAVATPVAAGLFRVWVHQSSVQVGYALSAQHARRNELNELVRQLELELAAERSPARLSRLAEQLGLSRPKPEQVVGLDAKPATAYAPSGGGDG